MKIDLLEKLRKYDTFLISTHVNPDPDALASMAAMGLHLEGLGKVIHLISEAPVPERFLFLPKMDKIRSLKEIKRVNYDAAIITDAGDLERIGDVCNLLNKDKPIINIDHHITNTDFGDINYVLSDYSSTCEVIFWLLKKDRALFTKELAELLYVGAMTDTGSFRYTNTTSRTHRMIAELMKFPIDANGLYKKIYEQVPLTDLKYFTRVVSEFDALCDGRLICVDLPKKIVRKFSEQFDLRDKLFGYLRTIEGVEVLVIFTEENEHVTRVNFRAQGGVDVARIASKFQGGGHSKASGCVIAGNIKTAHRKVLPVVKEAISDFPIKVEKNG
ncbi:MAG: bifunctional oligoribonuclease/PAP phosphatase NrnA [Candidatus Omnitrophota bacterium]